ncbi:ATP-grasp domain-containing protein [Vibrio sp. MEBiC08052]|uniref:ATP-grasp domain-containing protein n=1 Tax=Vibrio sp. MEBiC08052 TaxID=1761910 RepID=UPI00074076EC|nr:ATP-grasp domain-containing protein [Vibrio sp. MEBiC08052]KUI99009.1 carbamoylphosphate synthase large subunit [Vibrio sp. MEBiC08052]
MQVLITGARAPVALEWANIFCRQGHRVIMTDALKQPLGSFLKQIEGYVQTSSPRFSFADYQTQILDIIDRFDIDMVVPTCEEVFFLADIAKQRPEVDWLMPDAALLFTLHNKYTVFEALSGLPQVSLPSTRLIMDRCDVVCGQETVLKPVYSRFGVQVISDVTPQALATINITADMPWVQQQKIEGQPICNYALFEHGQMRVHQAYYPRLCVNQSAASAFQPIDDPAITEFMGAFGQRFNYHGQVSFDFIRDQQGLYVIECNPRATSGLHLVAPFCQSAEPHFVFAQPELASLYHLGAMIFLAGGVSSLFSYRRWQGYFSGKNIMQRYQQDLPPLAPLLSFSELYRQARKQRISLSQASTYDIEWNGQIYHA